MSILAPGGGRAVGSGRGEGGAPGEGVAHQAAAQKPWVLPVHQLWALHSPRAPVFAELPKASVQAPPRAGRPPAEASFLLILLYLVGGCFFILSFIVLNRKTFKWFRIYLCISDGNSPTCPETFSLFLPTPLTAGSRLVLNFFFFGVHLLYSLVLISALQRSELAICIYPLFFGFLFHLGHHRALSRVPCAIQLSSVTLSCLTLCDPHGLQHTRLPCPSPTPGACSNSRPSSL